MSTTDDLVPVMVHKQHLTAVYSFLGSLKDNPSSQNQEAAVSGVWTDALLLKMVRQSPAAAKDMLREMATKPGVWIPTNDLAGAIVAKPDASAKTVAGAMSALRRRIKNRYKMDSFPFEKRYDHSLKSKAFLMDVDMASRLLPMLDDNQ